MGLFNNWPPIRHIVQLVIIQLFCWLACSVSFCFAQNGISEGVTGSVNFPSALAITSVSNLAVFATTLIRGRLDREIGARDALGIVRGTKLTVISSRPYLYALATSEHPFSGPIDVVMLSSGIPNSSMREFMKSIEPFVEAVLLKFFRLRDAGDSMRNVQQCHGAHRCRCIVTSEDIKDHLERRMPGTLKSLSDSLCLLPCLTCLIAGCHGCNGGLLHTKEDNRLNEGNSIVQSPAEDGDVDFSRLVCGFLEGQEVDISIGTGEPFCICIPLNDYKNDRWAELLIRSFRSQDAEGRGVRDEASIVLEDYLAGGRGVRGYSNESVKYSIASFIVPRFTESLINIVLTFWFKVDGFSSSLVARRTVRDYIVDSKGSGFAANAFLTEAVVQGNGKNTCQLLSFRGNVVGIRTVSFTVGFVNMVCSIVWAVLIAFDHGADASPPPSMPRVAVILATIGIASVINYTMLFKMFSVWAMYHPKPFPIYMQLLSIFCPWFIPCIPVTFSRFFGPVFHFYKSLFPFFIVIHMEMMCFVSGTIVAATLGTKAFGRWLYAAVQILVFLKWAAASFLLDVDFWDQPYLGLSDTWVCLPYSTAFLLNGVLAGVRSTWGHWPWKDNHLWSRKFLH